MSPRRVLFITPEVPAQTGGGLPMRAGVTLRALGRLGDVTVVVVSPRRALEAVDPTFVERWAARTVVHHPDAAEVGLAAAWLSDDSARDRFARLEPLASSARFATPPAAAALHRHVRQAMGGDPEVVHVLRLRMSGWGLPWLRREPPPVAVLDLDDDEVLTHRRLADEAQRRANPRRAVRLDGDVGALHRLADLDLPAYTAIAVAAERDVEPVKRHGNLNAFELPNSVEIPIRSRLAPAPRRHARLSLLFVGAFNYPPNVWGAELLVEEVLPRVRARARRELDLALVGRPVPRVLELGGRPGVRAVGYAAELAPWYAAADVAVAPITAGGGTRTKILEACAHRVPVVATSLGAEGLDLEHGEHLLIADTPEAFADACVAVVEDPVATHGRVERAAARVAERYSHEVVVDGLVARYRALLGG